MLNGQYYPCCCCQESICLGSKNCPAANNERDFKKRCQELIDKEIPLKPSKFQNVLKSVNHNLQEEERIFLSTQIGL
jgi:hypothetical protein